VPGNNLYCDDYLGIPRDEMPQFKGTAQPGSRAAGMDVDASGEVDTEPVFKEMLAQKGIKTLQTQIPADRLKATQKDLVGAKVVGMMGALEKDPNHPKITAPIYVSRDGHVIDGHHRWAAVVAYNAANPDKQIPMKTTVLDMDIKDAIPMANKFAEDMGIAAKKADANKETPSDQLVTKQPEEVVDSLKGRTTSEGEELDVETTENGSMIIGVEHGEGNESTKETINQITSLPKDTKVMFVGEGGMSKDDNGNIELAGEQAEIRDAVKGHFDNAEESSWDENANVYDDSSPVYGEVAKSLGGSKSKAKAAIWSNMVGQGDDMEGDDYLDNEGRQWIIDQAKKAGATNITDKTDFNNLTDEERKDLYELNFNDEGNMGDNEIMKAQESYNSFRQNELDRKIKEAEDNGYKVIAPVGNSHVDMWRKRNKGGETTPTEKLPEPEAPSEEDGGVVYSLGGGYYSDKPNGPAQYVTTENVVEKVLFEGDETWANLLFEATVTKTTAKGNKVKLKTIEPKNQKKATVVAKAKQTQKATTTSTKPVKSTATKKEKKFVATEEDKARLKYRKEELAKIVESGLIPTQKKKLSGAGVFVPTEKQMQALLEVTKKQIEDPEYRLPLPKYDVSEEDIDTAIDKMKEVLGKEFSSVYNSIKKAGGVDPQLTTREAGNQRVRDILKKYLETGGRSAITGEFVPFNQMQLDHHVPYSSAAQRVADKKKKGIETTLLAEQDELDSPENWDLMETPLNQLKNSLEGNALIERINKKLSASPDEKEKKELETKIKNVRRSALLTSLVTSFGNGDFSGINEEALEQFNQDEMNVICKAWNWYHPNTKDADQFREIDPKYDEKLKERGIDTSVRHPLSITRGVRQQGGARGRGQTKPVGELRKSLLAVVKQAGIKLMTKKDVKKTDLALAKAVRDVESATKPYADRMTQLKQQIKQTSLQSKK
jgi:hypothetical protein